MSSRFLVLVASAVAVVGFGPGRADAHDLRAKVKLPPDSLVVEAGFDDDTPAEGAKVTITDPTGKVIAEGTTDERGVCRLPLPAAGKYAVEVKSLGHRDAFEFEVGGGSFFSGWRPNQAVGTAAGVAGLLGASAGFWWLRRKRPASQ